MKAMMTRDHVGTYGAHLTPREREVLSLLCEGLSNKLISRRLGVSLSTVKIHVSNIFGELNVSSRLEAVVTAHRHGLLQQQVGASQSEVARAQTFTPIVAALPLSVPAALRPE